MMNPDGVEAEPNSRSSTPVPSAPNSNTAAPVIVKITPVNKTGSSDGKEPFTENPEVAAPAPAVHKKPSVHFDSSSSSASASAAASDGHSKTKESFNEDAEPPIAAEVVSVSASTTPCVKRPAAPDNTDANDDSPTAPFSDDSFSMVSPTGSHQTYNVYNSYDSSASQSQASPQKIEIVTLPQKKKKRNRTTALICGMKKPVLILCVVLILGILATNFLAWFQIPGVDEQIIRLNMEIAVLDGEVDRLAALVRDIREENDRYETLNTDLTKEADDLEAISNDLNSTAADLRETNADLEQSSLRLELEIDELDDTSAELRGVRDELHTEIAAANATNAALKQRVDTLVTITTGLASSETQLRTDLRQLNATHRDLVDTATHLGDVARDLVGSVAEYARLNSDLTVRERTLRWSSGNLTERVDGVGGEVERLYRVEAGLNATVEDLRSDATDLGETLVRVNEQVANVTEEVGRLRDLNDDINVVLRYVSNSTNGASDTLAAFITFIEEENIEKETNLMGRQNRLVLDYAGLYGERIDNWYCTYEYEFAGNTWANDDDDNWEVIAIDDEQLDSVLDYVEERVLRPLCLNTTDFRLYLDNNLSESTLTTLKLINIVEDYTDTDNTSNAKDYYYDGSHVTVDDWVKADFSCHNLVNSYQWIDQSASNIFSN